MFHDVLHSRERAPYIIPCVHCGKCPLKGESLEQRAKVAMLMGEVRWRWGVEVKEKPNYGIIAGPNNLTIVDADSKDAARELYKRLPRTDMMTITPNGGHLYFRGGEGSPRVKCKIMGVTCDLRRGLSYVIGPGSTHPTGKPYERLGNWNLVDVPEFDDSWIEDVKPECSKDEIHRLESWLMQIESIQGSGGNRGLVRFVTKCRDHNFSQARCMELLFRWNESDRVQPPWSPEELVRAVENLYKEKING